jgi:hypothetical protein
VIYAYYFTKQKDGDLFALGLTGSMTGKYIGIRFPYQPDWSEGAGQKVNLFGALW